MAPLWAIDNRPQVTNLPTAHETRDQPEAGKLREPDTGQLCGCRRRSGAGPDGSFFSHDGGEVVFVAEENNISRQSRRGESR